MTSIHPTAVVAPEARLGEGVTVGPYAVVGPEAEIGDGCEIQAHAIVDGATTLGPQCQVFPFAHIGGKTQDLKFKEGNRTYVKVGARSVLRECVTINCGTKDGESTILGDDCLIMAYCHLAHGCVFGNHVIVSNASQFAATMSVATSTSVCPALKRYITSSRSCWERSECIWSQLMCICFRLRVISFTFSFLPEKMMTRCRSPFLKMWLMIFSFWGS